MIEFLRLKNPVKHYQWGSPHYIPELMGIADGGDAPWAELWMGAHSGSPSRVILPEGAVGLDELIASDPCRYLGKTAADKFGALPFLFKLLAAEKPLSIQAHPNLAQAQEGFARENRAGVPLDAPNRNYKDSNHKPEIICALTPFTGMCGFREPAEIRRLLAEFLAPLDDSPAQAGAAALREGFAPLLQVLEMPDTSAALRNFLGALFDLSPQLRRTLTDYILSAKGAGSPEWCPPEWGLMQKFARLYPGDPAVIAPLYLNIFHLEGGEAVYLDAGVLHAYCSGFGVELMANSDNVLRGGLTEKYVDVPELMSVLDFSPMIPRVIKPESSCYGTMCFTYPTPCEEFSLTRVHTTEGAFSLIQKSPSIYIVTEGRISIGSEIIEKGESIFVPPPVIRNEPLTLGVSDSTFYIASPGLS
jgi:mannose-6-phosphate isomerase